VTIPILRHALPAAASADNAKQAAHTCSYCKIAHDGTPEATFAHNTLPWHRLRVLAQTGAPEHLIREAALDCEDAVNNLSDSLTSAQYEAAFAALPHISGQVTL
jgi:hypothetical protein